MSPSINIPRLRYKRGQLVGCLSQRMAWPRVVHLCRHLPGSKALLKIQQ